MNYLQTSIRIFIFICFVLQSNRLFSTDLVVAPGGTGGSYATLGAAIAAASAGDRIIVYPQPNNAAYSETALTITKSLQILSANEGAFYTIDAPSITITPSTANATITIIGMKLITGGIATGAASPAGARTNINLMNDSIKVGAVSITHDNYNLTAAANYIDNGVTFKYGKLLGNAISSIVTVNNDASTNNVGDTTLIIGNRINYYTSVNTGGINWNSTSQFFNFQNNFIIASYPSNNTNVGIIVGTSRAGNAATNMILNNTICKITYSLYGAMSINVNATANVDLLNNLVVAPLYSYGIAVGTGNFNTHYNYCTSFSGFTNDGTNISPTSTTLNTTTGAITNPLSNAINGGTPDSAYADIDLTRNDAGCYGGSYTQDNFFPITANDWARVILVTAPRRVMVNSTINVKAIGFDK